MTSRLSKFLQHIMCPNSMKWHPLLSVFYLTYRCDFRCTYCSDGSGTPYHDLPDEQRSLEDTIGILQEIRRHCDSVVITGGEPLQHDDFTAVMRAIPDMCYKEVVLTTNGYTLDRYLPVIASSVTKLVISIDTLSSDKSEAMWSADDGAFQTIITNIQTAKQFPDKSYAIVISSVVSPDNIEDLYEVYEYARKNSFEFAACPQLNGVHVHPDLKENQAYRDFFDFLIREKRRNKRIYGTVLYLEYMRDIREFDCHPFTMLVVSPTGEVFYPCLELGKPAGNILETTSLHDLRARAQERFGPPPNCGNRCHSACALTFGTLINNPFQTIIKGCATYR